MWDQGPRLALFISALPYFLRMYRVLLLLLLINWGPGWCRRRHFQPMRINPWIFCRITFYGLYTLQPFWSIINPRLTFSFLTSQCLLCKLLSCCKQTFLIVKMLSNARVWWHRQVSTVYTWPNISLSKSMEFWPDLWGVCEASHQSVVPTWNGKNSIELHFRAIGRYSGVLVWTFGLIFQEAKNA